jgi:hypothetical protein
MKTRMLWLLCCLLALSSQAQTTNREVWVWKDANGVTHFSDTPGPGARRMEISGTTPAAPPPPAPANPSRPEASQGSTPPADSAAREYRTLEFTSPDRNAFFNGPDSEVTVQLRSDPELMPGDELTLYLDGNRVEEARNSISFTFRNLPRGTHTVNAVIRDANGVEKIRSLSRSFTVRQTAVNNPRNVGPSLRPGPVPLPAPAPSPRPAPPPTGK